MTISHINNLFWCVELQKGRAHVHAAPGCQAEGQGQRLVTCGRKGAVGQSQRKGPAEGPARQALIAVRFLPKTDPETAM